MKKNGKIELFRFVFAICVLFRHIDLKVYNCEKMIGPFTIGKLCYLGVEFFFIVSGVLFAKSIYKRVEKNNKCEHLGKETVSFMWSKIKSLLPYHIFACVFMMLFILVRSKLSAPAIIMEKLPSIFFIQNTGILGHTPPLIAMEWYLSAMLLSMAVIYPICRKHYETFTHVVAPLLGIFILGYVCKKTGHLSGTVEMLGPMFKSNYRAIGEILIGMSIYELSKYLSTLQYSKLKKICLSIIENGCYICAIIFMFLDLPNKFEYICLMLLVIAVLLSFTNYNDDMKAKIYNNKVFYFLGAVSLPIYLVQEPIWNIVLKYIPNHTQLEQSIAIFVGTLVLGIFLYIVVEKYRKYKSKVA